MMSITQIPYKIITFTNLLQIYHCIKKEFIQLVKSCLKVSHNVKKI